MEPQLSCIPCIIKQIIFAIRSVSGDQWLQKKVVSNVLQDLSESEFTILPVSLINTCFTEAVDKLGVSDPFQEQKKEVYDNFSDILNKIQKKAPEVDSDRVTAALKMSAAANHFPSFVDYEETFEQILSVAQKEPIFFELDKFMKDYRKQTRVVLLSSGFMEIPFDVYLLSLMGMNEICIIASEKPFLWQPTAEEITGLSEKLPFNAEVKEITYTNPQNDHFSLLNVDEFVICKGFTNYQYFEDYEQMMMQLYYANRWCQPGMTALGRKNQPQSGIVLKCNE